MSNGFIKLYSTSSSSENAFFLTEGKIFFYASNEDKYAITGKNLIIGGTELLLKRYDQLHVNRIETAITDSKSVVKRLSAEKFMQGMKSFSFAFNAAMVLAKQVMLTNQILQKNMDSLSGDEIKIKELSMEYYRIAEKIRDEYHKRKLPWLASLVQQCATSLSYKRGEAHCRSAEPNKIEGTTALSDSATEYERGSVLCEEGSFGNEMYILQSGSIDVIIKGHKVATIDEPGTIIGEMALLLGENRSATLKANNTVTVAQIKKEDLKSIVSENKNFLSNIAFILAKRHYYNIVKIESVNKSLIESALDAAEQSEKKPDIIEKTRIELLKFKQSVKDAVKKNKADFLKDFSDSI